MPQNAKYGYTVLRRMGIQVSGPEKHCGVCRNKRLEHNLECDECHRIFRIKICGHKFDTCDGPAVPQVLKAARNNIEKKTVLGPISRT